MFLICSFLSYFSLSSCCLFVYWLLLSDKKVFLGAPMKCESEERLRGAAALKEMVCKKRK